MNDLRKRLFDVSSENFGPTAASLMETVDLTELAPFVNRWSDLDICWAAVYPSIGDNKSHAVNLKEELLLFVKNTFVRKRDHKDVLPELKKVENVMELLTKTVQALLATSGNFHRFVGAESFCNIVFLQMKESISTDRGTQPELSINEESVLSKLNADLLQVTSIIIGRGDSQRLDALISTLSFQEQSLLVDYKNNMPFSEMSRKYNVSVYTACERVQELVDRLRCEF